MTNSEMSDFRKILVVISPCRSHGTSLMTKLLHFSGMDLFPFSKLYSSDSKFEIYEHTTILKATTKFLKMDPIHYNEPLPEVIEGDPFMDSTIDIFTNAIKEGIENYIQGNFCYKNPDAGRLIKLHEIAYERADVEPVFVWMERPKEEVYASIVEKYWPDLSYDEFKQNYLETCEIMEDVLDDKSVYRVDFNELLDKRAGVFFPLVDKLQEEGFDVRKIEFLDEAFDIKFTGTSYIPVPDRVIYEERGLPLPDSPYLEK